ncbi:hypothetical protein SK128_005253, partial [Halocaridina rubra]
FNETVAMDLRKFKARFDFLHIIDSYTRIGLARMIKRKIPSVILNNVIFMWITSGRGLQKKFLTEKD